MDYDSGGVSEHLQKNSAFSIFFLGSPISYRIAPGLPVQTKVKKHETQNKTVQHNRGLSSASLQNKKHCFAKRFANQPVLDSRNMFSAEHAQNSQSTIYLKSHGCVHGFQHEVSLINVSTMFCLPCALSGNSSLQDAKPAGHLFV